MGKLAYLFPGQGSQSVGMGADLCAHFPDASKVFDEADEQLGMKISTICFYGPEDLLKQTINTQPALFTTSVAALRAMEHAGVPGPQAVAGHSVGEYAALLAAGAFSFETGLQLVQKRAQEMYRAGEASPGTMAAILGLAGTEMAAICAQVEQSGVGIVQVANYNGGGQAVISGSTEGVTAASEAAKAQGARRVVPLNVSGAFHSSLMTVAAQDMVHALDVAKISDTHLPVVANLTADYQTSAAQVRTNLASQIDHSVRWEESIGRLVADGFDRFIEVGPGNVLSGLMKRMAPEALVCQAGNQADITQCAQQMASA